MYTARKARTVGADTRRRSPGARSSPPSAGALFGKAHALSEEVHMAMVPRGYTGDARTLAAFRVRAARRRLDRSAARSARARCSLLGGRSWRSETGARASPGAHVLLPGPVPGARRRVAARRRGREGRAARRQRLRQVDAAQGPRRAAVPRRRRRYRAFGERSPRTRSKTSSSTGGSARGSASSSRTPTRRCSRRRCARRSPSARSTWA